MHRHIIKLMKAIGLKSNEKGVCFGLSTALRDAILLSDKRLQIPDQESPLEIYNKRLALLNRLSVNDFKKKLDVVTKKRIDLIKAIKEDFYKRKPESKTNKEELRREFEKVKEKFLERNLSQEERMLLDVPIFLQNIELYHIGNTYSLTEGCDVYMCNRWPSDTFYYRNSYVFIKESKEAKAALYFLDQYDKKIEVTCESPVEFQQFLMTKIDSDHKSRDETIPIHLSKNDIKHCQTPEGGKTTLKEKSLSLEQSSNPIAFKKLLSPVMLDDAKREDSIEDHILDASGFYTLNELRILFNVLAHYLSSFEGNISLQLGHMSHVMTVGFIAGKGFILSNADDWTLIGFDIDRLASWVCSVLSQRLFPGSNDITPLIISISALHSRRSELEELLKLCQAAWKHPKIHNVNNEKTRVTDKSGNSWLHYAARENDVDTLEELLQYETDINKTDALGRTPLCTAVLYGHTPTLRVLIDAKADIDKADNEGYSPICTAALQEQTHHVKALIEAKANVNSSTNTGMTPLHFAARTPDCLAALINAGANVNSRTNAGCTPLHGAAYNRSTDCVAALIDAGANVNSQDQYGCTPLFYAKNISCIKLLLRAGANPHHANKNGVPAAIVTALQGLYECAEYLLDAKPQPQPHTPAQPALIDAKNQDQWIQATRHFLLLIKNQPEKSNSLRTEFNHINKIAAPFCEVINNTPDETKEMLTLAMNHVLGQACTDYMNGRSLDKLVTDIGNICNVYNIPYTGNNPKRESRLKELKTLSVNTLIAYAGARNPAQVMQTFEKNVADIGRQVQADHGHYKRFFTHSSLAAEIKKASDALSKQREKRSSLDSVTPRKPSHP